MDKETTAILEKLLERKLENGEKERLQRIQDTLRIGPNDALWAIIAAMEYPRMYYEELPEKIRAVTAGIFEDIAEASEKEVALAQSRLAESLSRKYHIHTWMTWGAAASFLLLLYGSLLLWVGFRLGSGQVQPLALLRMPAGIILAAICLCCGIFFGMFAAKKFSEENRDWRKFLLAAIACIAPGGCIIALTLV